jgi:hypothetical protein
MDRPQWVQRGLVPALVSRERRGQVSREQQEQVQLARASQARPAPQMDHPRPALGLGQPEQARPEQAPRLAWQARQTGRPPRVQPGPVRLVQEQASRVPPEQELPEQASPARPVPQMDRRPRELREQVQVVLLAPGPVPPGRALPAQESLVRRTDQPRQAQVREQRALALPELLPELLPEQLHALASPVQQTDPPQQGLEQEASAQVPEALQVQVPAALPVLVRPVRQMDQPPLAPVREWLAEMPVPQVQVLGLPVRQTDQRQPVQVREPAALLVLAPAVLLARAYWARVSPVLQTDRRRPVRALAPEWPAWYRQEQLAARAPRLLRRTDRLDPPLQRRQERQAPCGSDRESPRYFASARCGRGPAKAASCGLPAGPFAGWFRSSSDRSLGCVRASDRRESARRRRLRARHRGHSRPWPHRAGPACCWPGRGSNRPADRGCRHRSPPTGSRGLLCNYARSKHGRPVHTSLPAGCPATRRWGLPRPAPRLPANPEIPSEP